MESKTNSKQEEKQPIRKTLWMIRHAESTHNAKAPNEPDENFFNCGLTEKGKTQASKIQGPIDLLICSPLRRTLATYLHSNLKVKKFETMEELREWTTYGPSCMYELENPNVRETQAEFSARVAKAIKLIQLKSETRIAIVSHGVTLGEMCRQLNLKTDYRWSNAEVRCFQNVVFS